MAASAWEAEKVLTPATTAEHVRICESSLLDRVVERDFIKGLFGGW